MSIRDCTAWKGEREQWPTAASANPAAVEVGGAGARANFPAADKRAWIVELTQECRAATRAESASVTTPSSGQGGK